MSLMLSHVLTMYQSRIFLVTDPHVANESGLNDVPTEILHVLLLYLLQKTPEETGISSENLTTFLDAIRRGNILTSLLYSCAIIKIYIKIIMINTVSMQFYCGSFHVIKIIVNYCMIQEITTQYLNV